MRTRELLFALAAGSGAIFALLHILGADRPHAAPPAATTADREPPPGPAADAAPAPDDGAGTPPDSGPWAPLEAPADVRGPAQPIAPWPPSRALDSSRGADPAAPLADPGIDPQALADRLVKTGNYREFLRTLGGLYESLPRAPLAPGSEDGEDTARPPDPDAVSHVLLGALDAATDPVVRQHLIFHVAMAVPPETAFPRLRALSPCGGGGDGEDALCALAFRGDPASVREFLALAVLPAPVDARRLVDPVDHDRLAEAGERDLLRAWRCVEALQGRPYFALHDRVFWDSDLETPAPRESDLAAEILPAWLERYDGHPGSDDMALRLARIAWTKGDPRGAIRWASRAATLPDADAHGSAAALLAAAAELAPMDDVLATCPDPADPDRNRNLLAYVRLRRLAADRGFAAAVAEADHFAAREPWLPLSRAFRSRSAEPPPRGLQSGVRTLPGDDPLLREQGERLPDDPLLHTMGEYDRGSLWTGPDGIPLDGEALRELRLRPSLEPVRLPPRRLAFQFRCWETLAALEGRTSATRSSSDRADLVYRQAAILFHNRDSLYPLHSPWRIHGSGRAWPVAAVPAADPASGELEPDLAWCRRNLPRLRAADLFEWILADGPGTPVGDRAAYSLGLACVMAAREPPLLDGHKFAVEIAEPRRLLKRCVGAFERCARDYPGSPLAPEAAALAGRWRERLGAIFPE